MKFISIMSQLTHMSPQRRCR